MNAPTTLSGSLGAPKVYYETAKELVQEWQDSGSEDSIWTYLGLTEFVYKEWVAKLKRHELDT